jgi:hypothetical protein
VNGHRGHTVRSPIAVKPIAYSAPGEIKSSGSATVPVKTGYTGTLTTTVAGLVPAAVSTFDLDKSGPDFIAGNPAASSRTGKITVTVPAGSVGRFGTYAADYPAGTDIDVYVYQAGTKTRVAPVPTVTRRS